ncbi:NADH-dependent flavin oxidoreductase [Testudinibacter sp. TR-2022]|nr:NADH-dependent flavin oxidoreductase [Pasteurellaceae bacterium Phil11]TNH23184.1 NADH-dependent flavin oxidoreductase [Testudinibacter sp. TR-2022]TNH23661.1 NADH-dependent flavin oxidoreductase [Testudinibacter sp. TR-2022]
MTEKLTFKRGLTLKNRTVMSPMVTCMSFHNGVVTSDEMNYFALRSGEVGAVIVGATYVDEGGMGPWEGLNGISDDNHIEELAKLAKAIQVNGTKAIIQIYHGGRITSTARLRGVQPVAPSAVKSERPGAETPRELSEAEILAIIEDFKKATARAIAAGFDGVELHGANTLLIQQFFSPHSNRRADQWGGSREKRFSFIDKLVDGVTGVVDDSDKKGFVVGYRLSPEEYETPGIRLEDTLYLVDKLADKPLDYLHLSLSRYNAVARMSGDYQEKSMTQYIHEKIAGRVPLITVGGIVNQATVDEALENAEMVAIGKALITDPHWVSKVMEDREDEIVTTLSHETKDELYIKNPLYRLLVGY